MKMKKKKTKDLHEIIHNTPIQDASEDYCIKSNIATSYTFNPEDPSFPYCKANGNCKFKIENYTVRPNCLLMHQIYEKEIQE